MRDAVFMGSLTASATHEMQNILATIRESSGLLEDLLALGGEDFAHAERFKKGLRVMAEQVERGMVLTEQLNYCAHAPETAKTGAEVNEALRSLVGLSRRKAAQGRVSLELAPGRAGLRTALCALEVMALAGLALDCCLPLLARDARLMLSIEELDGCPAVRLNAPGFEALRAQPGFGEFEQRALSLQAELRAGPDGQGVQIVLPRPAA